MKERDSNRLKRGGGGSDRLDRKIKDEILTSLKEWKNERKAWGGVSGFRYTNIECK
jgi:hypothetical protein